MNTRKAILVVDLAYGDCGKGTIVDFPTRQCRADAVVRFSGGPQAGHNVVTPDGRHHTFSQFGSGTFVPGVQTVLSRYMLVEPYALYNEEAHLRQIGISDAMTRLHIDARCPIITPIHQAANRLREVARGSAAHGTCGMGVGEIMQDLRDHPEVIFYAGDLADRALVKSRLLRLRDLKASQLHDAIRDLAAHPELQLEIQTLLDLSWMETAFNLYARLHERVCECDQWMRSSETLVFEGAQGVLLDETFGFYPYTTWSTTTFQNAEQLLNDSRFDGQRTRIGVLRSYFTRHGPGPLVTEDAALRGRLAEPHHSETGWQGRFRTGPFDAVAARYALSAAGGVDLLAITHLDQLEKLPPRICAAYANQDAAPFDLPLFTQPTTEIMDRVTQQLVRCKPVYTAIDGPLIRSRFLEHLETLLNTSTTLQSFGPTANEKIWHGQTPSE